MRVLVRADASIAIGVGHVARCLTIAEELTNAGFTVEFICRETTGNAISLIEKNNYKTHRLPDRLSTETDAELTKQIARSHPKPAWLVVDHYALDADWHHELRPFTNHIMVIDDLANRPHDCDLLLDQNLHPDPTRYDQLTPTGCQKLLGPTYALLRREFQRQRAELPTRPTQPQRILISFGGSDPTGETMNALLTLDDQPPFSQLRFDCVLGAQYPGQAAALALQHTRHNLTCHVQTTQMATLMAHAHVGIGAGGSTVWERCCLGLPTITVAVSDHQAMYCQHLANLGYIHYAGYARQTEIDYPHHLTQLLTHPEERQRMSDKGLQLVDGLGSERVMRALLGR